MRVIRKYPNRRLYDTTTGAFINLADLRKLVEAGEALQVLDKASGQDITRSLLLQIIVEAEEQGQPMLSGVLLGQLIRFHGHAMQGYMSRYLEQSVALFLGRVDEMQTRFSAFVEQGPLVSLQELGRQNLELWQRWQNRLLGSRDDRDAEDPGDDRD